MTALRRLWTRDSGGEALTACTALDVGTEFAKALVFEIDGDRGVVKGVGRKRQGLAHMQSGTVADISAVVDNCAVALQEAEEMAGFRPEQVVIGIAGELVKGFTTVLDQQRARADVPISQAELGKLIEGVQRQAMHEAERSVTWETGPAERRRPARARRRRGGLDRRVRGDQPDRLPGPQRPDRDLRRVRAAGPPRRAPDRGREARHGADRGRRGAVRRRAGPRQRAGPTGRRAVRRRRRRHDRRGPGAPGRDRGDADVRARRPGVHEVDRGPTGAAVPARRGAQGRLRPRHRRRSRGRGP